MPNVYSVVDFRFFFFPPETFHEHVRTLLLIPVVLKAHYTSVYGRRLYYIYIYYLVGRLTAGTAADTASRLSID